MRDPNGQTSTVADLVYWYGKDTAIPARLDEEGDLEELGTDMAGSITHNNVALANERESMYVALFERMERIVLKDEAHLLSTEELLCLDAYNKLSYRARFLLVRLALRKHDRWHRLSKLTFQSELGPYIPDAMAELCHRASSKVKSEEPEIIDLTLDDGSSRAGPSRLSTDNTVPTAGHDLTFFAEDETAMTLSELIECLALPEINMVTKELKLKGPQSRSGFITAILHYSGTQGALSFPVFQTAKAKGKRVVDAQPSRQTRLTFTPTKAQSVTEHVREIVLKILKKCIRVNLEVIKLFRRLNIIFFRDTQFPDKILTPSLLSHVRKRYYPSYAFVRTSDIWQSRKDLLDFEKAMELEAEIQEYLDTSGAISGSKTRKTMPIPTGDLNFKASLAPTHVGNVRSTSCVPAGSDADALLTPSVHRGKAKAIGILGVDEDVPVESPRVRGARAIKAAFEPAFMLWKELIAAKSQDEPPVEEQEARRRRGLRRFECGHVYTRIVQKGADALGILKEHEYELEVLEALLSQRQWRRGSRGAWHDRRALILMNHLKGREQNIQRALNAVIDGLQDDDTHIIYRPKLEKRLTVLEKKLKISENDRHTYVGGLVRPEKVCIEGIRVKHKASSVVPDSARSADTPDQILGRSLISYGITLGGRSSVEDKEKEDPNSRYVTGKSVWVGRDGEDVSVEILALQEYEMHGYKGFHCEGRIVTTLFGLLFWDILFADIPGALETPWQSAPMDIAEDSFYFSRKELIEERLSQIEAGEGPTIVAKFDDLHREHDTLCVGVRWDLFTKQDLVEIANCIGGKPLSVICRLLAEDYACRTSGIPDLVVWKVENRDCKFVEVKGPGDTERENQKIWMDVLLRAEITVEVCRVEERGHAENKQDEKKAKKASRKRRAAEKHKIEEPDSSPDIDHQRETLHTAVRDKEEKLTTFTRKPWKRRRQMEVVVIPPSKM